MLELDDSSVRDHLLYPKDLAVFARDQRFANEGEAPPSDSGVVRTGQVCPESGIWKAVGHNMLGVMVRQGEVMTMQNIAGYAQHANCQWNHYSESRQGLGASLPPAGCELCELIQ
ncbi:hypothetical protein [Paraburkholderia sp. GAS348]|uniref:hypothetical protein n=1 Tax=Paraburkholderia sp. GAS348 TaxID=3035132 RepID=UPI003D1F3700